MRMVHTCMVIICAMTLALPLGAQSETQKMQMNTPMMMMPGGQMVPAPGPMQQGDMMMMQGQAPMMMQSGQMMPAPQMNMQQPMMQQTEPMPVATMGGTMQGQTRYTSPSGIMKHNRSGMMMQNPMMMQNSRPMREMKTMDDVHNMMRMGMMNQQMMMMHDKLAAGKPCGADCPLMDKRMMQMPPMMSQDMMQDRMMQRNMMRRGKPYNNKFQRTPMMRDCTMCSKVYTKALTPAIRTRLMRSLTEFDAQNKPMYDELAMLRQQYNMMQRQARKSPAKRTQLETKRNQVRKALMENLKRQSAYLKSQYNIDVTPKEMLVHRLHQMNGIPYMYGNMPNSTMMRGRGGYGYHKSRMRQNPHMTQQYDTQKMRLDHGMMMNHRNPLEKGYRNPQQHNPDYNQQYLRQAPLRETYQGQTYEQ